MGGFNRTEAWRRVLFAAVFAIASLAATGTASAARDLTILAAPTSGVAQSPPGTFTPTADNAVLNVADLNTALGTSDAVVNAGNTGTQAGQITVGAAISWSGARELTLTADDDVVIQSPISASDPGGSLTLEAAGAILQNATGQILIAGPTSLTANLGVNLDQANNDFGGPLSIESATAEIEIKDNGGGIILGPVSANGGSIDAQTGGVTQTGPITSGGELSVVGTTVALTNPGNDFDRLSASGNIVGVRDVNALELTGFTAIAASFVAGTDLAVTTVLNQHLASSVTLVTDAAAGSAVGPGGIEVAPGVPIESTVTPLKIYTARRDQNTIPGSAFLNGEAFTPGPEFVDSATEVWNTASPNGTATDPFTIFYKQAKPVVAPPVDPPTPDTTLTGTPKRKIKTKRKKVKVSFAFTSNVVGSTFTCALDGRAISCNSPFQAKVKKGKHSFSVAATAGGKIDPTPASFSFKVKGKPKRR